ncbi:MAG: hypothetical protein R2843_06100 [Thermomicrobiales bacterium]
MTQRLSLRSRFVIMALVCLLPLTFVIYYVIDQSLQESRDKTIENEVAIAEVIAANVTLTLDEHINVLTDIASTEAVRTLNADMAQSTVGQFLRARPGLYSIMLIDAQSGQAIVSSGSLDPQAILPQIQTDIDATFTTGEPTITGLIPSTSSEGINMVALIVPVRADPAAAEVGAPVGVLVGFLNVERLGRSFSSAFAIAETDTSAAVVDGEQVIISQTNTDNPDEALVSDLAAPIAAAVGGIRSISPTLGRYRTGRGLCAGRIQRRRVGGRGNQSGAVDHGRQSRLRRPGASCARPGDHRHALLATLFGDIISRPIRRLTARRRPSPRATTRRRSIPAVRVNWPG